MGKIYRTPGVYVEEISSRYQGVAQVETAIPAFVGYTEKAEANGQSLLNQPTRVNSFLEFLNHFGGDNKPQFEIVPALAGDPTPISVANRLLSVRLKPNQRAYLFQSVQDFFDNGGAACYIVSVGTYSEKKEVDIRKEDLLGMNASSGLKALEEIREPSILAIPDAVALGRECHDIYREMLQHCKAVGNRFSIFDIFNGFEERLLGSDCIEQFRNEIGSRNLSYGAAYYPWLDRFESQLTPSFENLDSTIDLASILLEPNAQNLLSASGLSGKNLHQALVQASPTYRLILESMARQLKSVPVCGAIAGIFSSTDINRGVWKAPAGESINGFEKPCVSLTDVQQQDLNQGGPSGKSINALRQFSGRGIVVWGARTLAGNDNEWRYISVKRTYLMIEESIQKALQAYVFEPNNTNTWNQIRFLCKEFLLGLWKQRAIQGSKPDDAYFVRLGLGQTMTALDILDGKLIVEIGMAFLRPAEFIILQIMLKMEIP